MLPKVATNLLHSTVTRSAAAAVQNHSNLRNVLKPTTTASGSASTSGSSTVQPGLFTPSSERPSVKAAPSAVAPSASKANAHGGAHGPGSGGAKKNKAGSRFYTGYNGAARAVTQANALTSQDASTQAEEEDLHPAARRALLKKSAATPKTKRTRLRSSSVSSLSLGLDKGKEKEQALIIETGSVLKTVQLQARSLHALTAAQQQSQAAQAETQAVEGISVAPPAPSAPEQVQSSEASAPVRARSRSPRPRRNSISSPVSTPSSPLIHPTEIPLPPSPLLLARHSSTSANLSAEEAVTHDATPEPQPSSSSLEQESESAAPPAEAEPAKANPLTDYGRKIANAREKGHNVPLRRAIEVMIAVPTDAANQPSVADFNVAIDALKARRSPLQPLDEILAVYNALLARSLRPNIRTYIILIELFAERDWEVQRVLTSLNKETRSDLEPQLETMRKENNFASAMKIFEAVVFGGANGLLPMETYTILLRSAGLHGNVPSAVHILSKLEERGKPPIPDCYRYLIQAFAKAEDFKGAELVFQKYRAKETANDLRYLSKIFARKQKLAVWNQMIEVYFQMGAPEKALELLEALLKSAEKRAELAGKTPSPKETEEWAELATPAPASSTYSTIIGGFIYQNDLDTALKWFNKLLEQEDAPGEDPFLPVNSGRPMRPDTVAWTLIMTALAKENRIDDLNKLWIRMNEESKAIQQAVQDGKERRDSLLSTNLDAKRLMFDSNINSLASVEPSVASARLDYIAQHVVRQDGHWNNLLHRAATEIPPQYLAIGQVEEAARFVEGLVDRQLQRKPTIDEQDTVAVREQLKRLSSGTIVRIHEALAEQQGNGVQWSFASAASLARMASEQLEISILPEQAAWLVHAYAKDKATGLVDTAKISMDTWRIMLSSAVYLEQNPAAAEKIQGYAFQGVGSLLADLAAANVAFDDELCDIVARAGIVGLVQRRQGAQFAEDLFNGLGGAYAQTYQDVVAAQQAASPQTSSVDETSLLSTPPTSPGLLDAVSPFSASATMSRLHTDVGVSKDIDALLKNYAIPIETKTDQAYGMYEEAMKKGKVPISATIGRLIQTCGRLGQMERVRELYSTALATLAGRRANYQEVHKKREWVGIEDSMIVALAHAGDVDAAHVHRLRILEMRIAAGPRLGDFVVRPSADAYGALILHVKDTTDDASSAMMLWGEALAVGVRPNVYLFNNIISKLARARKADAALDLFREMKARGVQPTSITYGAVIGACARVGDVVSSEALFEEMAGQANFKPRVPPFNMMMQLYVTTKPNREKALGYYEQIIKAGIKPTAHTYKLLLDAYGSIEPVDIGAMESVFEKLRTERQGDLTNMHFASLINAYGCVTKQLDKAIDIFNTIPQHGIARDAVSYEALMHALVANKRPDLIQGYMARMAEDEVHMTAYVANFLIKGYANGGDVEMARRVFEGMADPPTGVAAPGNHAPHEPGAAMSVSVEGLVYREPSTWEAMIRAELGAGERERALALLERMKVRGFPEAVFNRISGVLVDHSAPSAVL